MEGSKELVEESFVRNIKNLDKFDRMMLRALMVIATTDILTNESLPNKINLIREAAKHILEGSSSKEKNVNLIVSTLKNYAPVNRNEIINPKLLVQFKEDDLYLEKLETLELTMEMMSIIINYFRTYQNFTNDFKPQIKAILFKLKGDPIPSEEAMDDDVVKHPEIPPCVYDLFKKISSEFRKASEAVRIRKVIELIENNFSLSSFIDLKKTQTEELEMAGIALNSHFKPFAINKIEEFILTKKQHPDTNENQI